MENSVTHSPGWKTLMIRTVLFWSAFFKWTAEHVESFLFCFKARHGWGRDVPTKAASHSGEIVFHSIHTFALLLTTAQFAYQLELCAKIIVMRQHCLMSVQSSGLFISTAWSEHAKNIPQSTFWPMITDLWSERLEGLRLQPAWPLSNLPKHEWPLHQRCWRPGVDLSVYRIY